MRTMFYSNVCENVGTPTKTKKFFLSFPSCQICTASVQKHHFTQRLDSNFSGNLRFHQANGYEEGEAWWNPPLPCSPPGPGSHQSLPSPLLLPHTRQQEPHGCHLPRDLLEEDLVRCPQATDCSNPDREVVQLV